MLTKLIFTIKLSMFVFVCLAQRPSQETNARPYRTDSTDVYLHLYEVNEKVKVKDCTSCLFHWFKNGKIQTTRGGYDGRLLHGNFSELYLNGALKQQGEFKKGLKDGEWRQWHDNGELLVLSKYKSGKLFGDYSEFDRAGKLIRSMTYKNGLPHGRAFTYSDSTYVVETYKKGVLKGTETNSNRSKDKGDHLESAKEKKKSSCNKVPQDSKAEPAENEGKEKRNKEKNGLKEKENNGLNEKKVEVGVKDK
jgi:MORN repeat variant